MGPPVSRLHDLGDHRDGNLLRVDAAEVVEGRAQLVVSEPMPACAAADVAEELHNSH